MLASEALTEVAAMLDDRSLIHATPEAGLRYLSRAQRFCAVRYALTRETQPLSLLPGQALYPLPPVFPRFVRVTGARLTGVGPLWLVGMDALRFSDTQWAARPATATEPPQWLYQDGLSFVGIYPVPITPMVAELTAAVEPHPLASTAAALVVPDAWLPRVIETAAGFAMIGSEKQYAQGVTHVLRGLGLTPPRRSRARVEA